MARRLVGHPIQNLTDEHLDDLTQNGVWHQQQSVSADTSRGYPGNGQAGLLEVFAPQAGMVYQRYTIFLGKAMYFRGWYMGKWGPWVEVATK